MKKFRFFFSVLLLTTLILVSTSGQGVVEFISESGGLGTKTQHSLHFSDMSISLNSNLNECKEISGCSAPG